VIISMGYWTRFFGEIKISPKISKTLAKKINNEVGEAWIYPERSIITYAGCHKGTNHFEDSVRKAIDVYLSPNGFICNGLIFAVGEEKEVDIWSLKVVNNRIFRRNYCPRFGFNEKTIQVQEIKMDFPVTPPAIGVICN
jgi:hypothetical protein